MTPEISDIPVKYGNLSLISSLLVFHENSVKKLLSQQINKLTHCHYAMSMLLTCLQGRQKKSLLNVSEKIKHDLRIQNSAAKAIRVV